MVNPLFQLECLRRHCNPAQGIITRHSGYNLRTTQTDSAALLGKPAAGSANLARRKRVHDWIELPGNALAQLTSGAIEMTAPMLLAGRGKSKHFSGFYAPRQLGQHAFGYTDAGLEIRHSRFSVTAT